MLTEVLTREGTRMGKRDLSCVPSAVCSQEQRASRRSKNLGAGAGGAQEVEGEEERNRLQHASAASCWGGHSR
eukprot:1159827-Pelagomonas_calceolata.AAC.20